MKPAGEATTLACCHGSGVRISGTNPILVSGIPQGYVLMKHSRQGEMIHRLGTLLLAVVLVWSSMPLPVRAGETTSPVRVLSTSDEALVLDVFPQGQERGVLLAIPWYGEPEVEILTQDEVQITSGRVDTLPSRAVSLQPLGYFREVRLARLGVAPTYRTAKGHVRRVNRVRVRVRFPQPPQGLPSGRLDPSLRDILRRAVVNPEFSEQWTRPRAWAQPFPPVDNPPARTSGALRVTVSAPGIQVIRRDDLERAGWDVDRIDPRNIHLWLNGTRVPLWIPGQGDGRLDPGDELRFYAPPFRSPYSREQVWWLTVENTPGPRWQTVETLPPTSPAVQEVWSVQRTEFDRVYDSNLRDARGEHWFWYDLRFLEFPPYPALDFPFWADAPAPSPRATVTLSLYAYKGDQHDLAFALNGVAVGEVHEGWTGRRDLTFSLPDGQLKDGQNTLTVRSTDRGSHPDGVYVDNITVRYRRRLQAVNGALTFVAEEGDKTYRVDGLPLDAVVVLDVTQPLAPVRIRGTAAYEDVVDGTKRVYFRVNGEAGAVYHVQARGTWQHPRIEMDTPSNWHNPSQGADVIVIAPGEWMAELQSWVAWRQAQGYRVAVVDIQDVYDEFSYGQVDPEAIRRFLRHAYASWPEPAPMYVLLVGDGSYDFKDNLGFAPDNIIPPYLAEVDPWLGETAADLKYVEVSGDDDIPDMFLGRWPVGSLEELAVVVRKTVFYGRDMPTAEWQRHIAFVTDNYRDAHGRPDAAGDFPSLAEQSASGQLGLPFVRDRLYYTPWAPESGKPGYISDLEDMRQEIRLLWNRGASIITWIGHASYEQWGEENFLHARELDALRNIDRLPFLLSMTCFTGYFHHPEYPSLDEALLVKADGGTVASWSPTGLAVAYGHQYLQEGFYRAIVAGERRVGALTLLAHLNLLAQAPTYAFLPQAYVTLGDPLLALRLGPIENVYFLPSFVGDWTFD